MRGMTITLASLLMLTLISVVFSNYVNGYMVFGIMVLAALKFVGISFYFMELKKAHSFWKFGLLLFLVLFMASVLFLAK
jgi:cytochrome c oxidase subunit IV